jgi:cyclin B
VPAPLPLEQQVDVEDIDAGDGNTPELVSDYVQDIYCHMREREAESVVDSTYMLRQPHINEKMRAILIDWLIDMHQKFCCVPETLYLTINLIDRFLEVEIASRKNLQLIGVTA